ncbi:hypothetical protein I541_5705 [Mycobacteroides abscessus]|nr:hypothetical protein I541_5705 [Mycobacteroides abscessus]
MGDGAARDGPESYLGILSAFDEAGIPVPVCATHRGLIDKERHHLHRRDCIPRVEPPTRAPWIATAHSMM